ncbi:MAG: sigma-70 family RNA polymerase sigma factor [Candidatus Peribacteraceae bacterium]
MSTTISFSERSPEEDEIFPQGVVSARRQETPVALTPTGAEAHASPAQPSLLRDPIAYVYNREFDDVPEEHILAPLREDIRRAPTERADGSDPFRAALNEYRTLTAEQEHHLFRQAHYCLYRAEQLRLALRARRGNPRTASLHTIARWKSRGDDILQTIVLANLRLVYTFAGKRQSRTLDFASLLSEGTVTLCRSVRMFDYGRGTKFSTYLGSAVARAFIRLEIAEWRQAHLPLPEEELPAVGSRSHPSRNDSLDIEATVGGRRREVAALFAQLNEREQRIIRWRFAHDGNMPTREEIGSRMGVCETMVRTIEARAIEKMRSAIRRGTVRILSVPVDWKLPPQPMKATNDGLRNQKGEV